MTDLEVLEAYRGVMMEMQVLEQQLRRFGSGAPREARAQRCDEERRGTNHQQAASMQHMDSLDRQLEARRMFLSGIMMRFERIVAEAGDATLAYMLRGYYAMGHSDAQIASALHCSDRTVNRRRRMFLRELAQRREKTVPETA